MSRFYANIQGNRGAATRMGTAASGIQAHPRGWDLGVNVVGYAGNGDRDNFAIRLSSGSHASRHATFVLEVTDLGHGWRRVAMGEVFGGEVFYLDPNDNRLSKPDGAPADVRAAWLAS